MKIVAPSLLSLAALTAGCTGRELPRVASVAGGDVERGLGALARYDCGVCHVIPGVAGPAGHVGPTLQHFARRPYLAGKFVKEPSLLVRWIVDAPAMAPRTAMPAVGVTEPEARDMAAYLLSLR